MKRLLTYVFVGLLFSVCFTTGCKWVEVTEEEAEKLCTEFDTALRESDTSTLDNIFATDFVFLYKELYGGTTYYYSYHRGEFIYELVGSDYNPWEVYYASSPAVISNIVIAEDGGATVDMDYTSEDYSISCETSIIDEGDFFTSDWKIRKVILTEEEEVGVYSIANSIRLHELASD